MARRKRHEEQENHERWLISYADFITLLFAFFVVMYSISSVNEGKYRVLSDSLVNAFRQPAKAIEPIQIGQEQPKTNRVPHVNFVERPNLLDTPAIVLHPPDYGERRGADSDQLMGRIAEELSRALSRLMQEGLITVRHNDLWLEVEIRDSVLFPSGSAMLHAEAVPVLQSVVEVLRDFPNPIRVEGFTDDRPIDTLLYPSNWELSTARASSVVRLFTREGISPGRMSALGYAEFRPVADNRTTEGRARNRRVVLVVLADDRLAHVLEGHIEEAQDPRRPGAPASRLASGSDGESAPRPQAVAEPAGSPAPPPATPRPAVIGPVIPMPESVQMQMPMRLIEIAPLAPPLPPLSPRPAEPLAFDGGRVAPPLVPVENR